MSMTMPAATSTAEYTITNPATGETLRESPALTDQEAAALLDRAHETFQSWKSMPIAERLALMTRIADVVEAHIDELAELATLEMGKPFAQAQNDARMGVSMFRYLAAEGERLLESEELDVAGFSRVYTRREPMGVVLAIEPWNGPIYQAARAAAPNLLLGNTIVLKPAGISSGSTIRLGELFEEAGVPSGVFQTALITHTQVTSFIEDPRVRAVTLTGSDRAGAIIGEQAGRNLKPAVLELGGSDPFIVLRSADPVKVASVATTCRLFGAGQICASPKRVIVEEPVADAFIAQYVADFAAQVMGDPMDPATTVGPLSTAAGVRALTEQYQDAVGKGATVLLEGGPVDGPGYFFRPAVLTDITPDMRLYREEAFGPIGLVFRVADADAAIELANDSDFGLGGSVYGEDLDEAHRVAQALDVGMAGINSWLAGPVEVPFGGTKRSGIGRELGGVGLDAFANIKSYGFA